jgi:hypothetical protein
MQLSKPQLLNNASGLVAASARLPELGNLGKEICENQSPHLRSILQQILEIRDGLNEPFPNRDLRGPFEQIMNSGNIWAIGADHPAGANAGSISMMEIIFWLVKQSVSEQDSFFPFMSAR